MTIILTTASYIVLAGLSFAWGCFSVSMTKNILEEKGRLAAASFFLFCLALSFLAGAVVLQPI